MWVKPKHIYNIRSFCHSIISTIYQGSNGLPVASKHHSPMNDVNVWDSEPWESKFFVFTRLPEPWIVCSADRQKHTQPSAPLWPHAFMNTIVCGVLLPYPDVHSDHRPYVDGWCLCMFCQCPAQLHSFCSLFLKLVNNDKCLFCLWQCFISTAPFKKDKYSITFSFLLVVSFIIILTKIWYMLMTLQMLSLMIQKNFIIVSFAICSQNVCQQAASVCRHIWFWRWKPVLWFSWGVSSLTSVLLICFLGFFLCKAMPKPKSDFWTT